MKMFGIRDGKTAAFGNPMAFQSRGQCMRSVSDEINRRNGGDQLSVLQQHPEDFELFELGEFDTETGVCGGQPVSVCNCAELKLSSN